MSGKEWGPIFDSVRIGHPATGAPSTRNRVRAGRTSGPQTRSARPHASVAVVKGPSVRVSRRPDDLLWPISRGLDLQCQPETSDRTLLDPSHSARGSAMIWERERSTRSGHSSSEPIRVDIRAPPDQAACFSVIIVG